MKRLGVNIDHVATIRNARSEDHPNVYNAAKFALKCGAHSITIHLREDRRHINDKDLKILASSRKIPLNLELSTNKQVIKIALKNKPNYVCIVPEKRKEITTEGGLNLKINKKKLRNIIQKFKKKKIRTSLFINPNFKDILNSKYIGTDCVEIHTGKISRLIKSNKNYTKEFVKIKKCSQLANRLGIEVHAGHGMDYKTAKILNKIVEIKEFNIGHFIIGESVFFGLKKTIKNFIKIFK
tara:strand:- start:4446 stop:5162 length:717 start_codon:yes stop_codon:yes gene_type:complete